jgi:hypothetical protein
MAMSFWLLQTPCTDTAGFPSYFVRVIRTTLQSDTPNLGRAAAREDVTGALWRQRTTLARPLGTLTSRLVQLRELIPCKD